MALSKPNKIQILNEDLEVLEEEAAEMINKLNIGKDRMLISIIGATGSGKSSICNCLFNCDFDEKTPEQTSRVTVGGWLYYCKEHNILVFDSEGIGCEERFKQLNCNKELSKNFDKTLTLFSMCISDVLMINIICSQITQSTSSCFELLKNITDAYKEMFIQDEANKKTIIFVIARFDDESHDKDNIIEKIKSNLNMQTSNDCAGTNILNFFNIEYAFIHCKYDDEELFNNEIKELRQTILSHRKDSPNNLPPEELPSIYQRYLHNIKTKAKFSIEAVNNIVYQLSYYLEKSRKFISNRFCKIDSIENFHENIGSVYDETFKSFDDNIATLKIDESNKDLYIDNRLKLENFIKEAISNKYLKLIEQKRESIEKDSPITLDNLILKEQNYKLNAISFNEKQLKKIDSFIPKMIDIKFGLHLIYNKQKALLDKNTKELSSNYSIFLEKINRIKNNSVFCFLKYIAIPLHKQLRVFKLILNKKFILFFCRSLKLYLKIEKRKLKECEHISEKSCENIFNKLIQDLYDEFNKQLAKVVFKARNVYPNLWFQNSTDMFDSFIEKQCAREFIISVTEKVNTDINKFYNGIFAYFNDIKSIAIPIFEKESNDENSKFKTKDLIEDDILTNTKQLFIEYRDAQTRIAVYKIITRLKTLWIHFPFKMIEKFVISFFTPSEHLDIDNELNNCIIKPEHMDYDSVEELSIVKVNVDCKIDGSKDQIMIKCMKIPEFNIE